MDKKSLIAQINKNLTVPESPASPKPVENEVSQPKKKGMRSERTEKPVAQKSPATGKPKKNSVSGSGKQTALWLDDEDRSILHEMGMLLYSQGIKPSHNVVIRAAIRLMPKDHRFFEKVQELASQDGRKIRHQT